MFFFLGGDDDGGGGFSRLLSLVEGVRCLCLCPVCGIDVMRDSVWWLNGRVMTVWE